MTARLCAAARGAHLRLDQAPYVLEDGLADAVSGFTPQELVAGTADQLGQFLSPSTRATMTARSRIVEDAVAENAVRGPLQYVIFGAGLDTFAYRRSAELEHVAVYEVDYASTQNWKRQKLAEVGVAIPGNTKLIDVDFETEAFEEKLGGAGLDAETPTVFSLLGVSQYITTTAFRDLAARTTTFVSGHCELILNFIPPVNTLPDASAEAVRTIAEKSAEQGEPFVSFYTWEQIEAVLTDAGFIEVEHFDPPKVRRLYFDRRTDGLTAGNVLRMARAIRPA
ncbi:MAG: class I SAM-dependent methyltransferase [Pseudomonadota bacterium]